MHVHDCLTVACPASGHADVNIGQTCRLTAEPYRHRIEVDVLRRCSIRAEGERRTVRCPCRPLILAVEGKAHLRSTTKVTNPDVGRIWRSLADRCKRDLCPVG